MANRFFTPNAQFFANPTTGEPLAGGKLYFYATGSSTPLETYSNSGLSITNTNPVILDSNGYSGDIFLGQFAYKVVLTDSNNVQIWTADPVWTSDFSTIAQVQVVNGSPNGQLAGTAGTFGGLPSSMAWDRLNDILYVCTTTGGATGIGAAVWTAVNPPASTTTAVSPPQGYLTLTSGTPIIPGNVTAATAVYYTPFTGNTVPIYDSNTFAQQIFAELTLTLSASHALNTIYDVFVFNNLGTITLATGPAWSNSGSSTGARGTGAGTTQISLLSGIYVNSVVMTGRNGASTYTIPANQATYLGSIFIDGTAGQVSCYRTYGQGRKWGVWNYYNRVPVYLKAGDATASWTYATATIRISNNAAGNSVVLFSGVAEDTYDIRFMQKMNNATAGGTQSIGIGFNSTSAYSGFQGFFTQMGTFTGTANTEAEFITAPALGITNVYALEDSNSANTGTFYGTEANMLLLAKWRA